MKVEELSGPELRHLLAGTAMAVAEAAGKGQPLEHVEPMLRRCGELYRALKANEKHAQREAGVLATLKDHGAADGKGEQQGEGGTPRASAHSSPSGTH